MAMLLTAAQMRALEGAAIASGAVTGLELMERAGRGVVEAILAEWPEVARAEAGGNAPAAGECSDEEEGAGPLRVVVLCGPGNNGGDGFVVARLLKERGWLVQVWFLGTREGQPADAGAMHDRWLAAGGNVFAIPQPLEHGCGPRRDPWNDCPVTEGHAFVIDALFGTGLSRPIATESGLWRAFEGHFEDCACAGLRIRHVAIDIPSGLCADSGRVLSPNGPANFRTCFHADLTVATGAMKLGHWLDEGPSFCGKVVVASLGWLGPMGFGTPGFRKPTEGAARLMSAAAIGRTGMGGDFPRGPRHLAKGNRGRLNNHKYAHGHALILSGPSGRGGAARLAARGALRIGAGVVTLGCPSEAVAENAARLDAVMLREVADGAALAAVLEDRRINALCLGPGLGTGAREAGLVAVALGVTDPVPGLARDLSQTEAPGGGGGPGASPGRGVSSSPPGLASTSPRPLVLDADALTILSQRPDLFAALHHRCILTPHEGEFARLFPDIAEKLAAPATKGPAYSKVDATRAAARRAGCVVLFKGPDTVIAEPSGRCAINAAAYDRAAPWLATAGSGDVLAGFIAGLLARGFAPFEAACTAAWLHVECALSFGPGLIAEDLPEELPKVFRALGL